MSTDDDDDASIDARLSKLIDEANGAADRCRYRTTSRLAREVRRLAKAERRIFPYIRGTFSLMNHAAEALEPEVQRDAALELIALLEDDAAARRIQPDLDEGRYETAKHWYSSCAYDNFASAIGNLNGYNSHGLHACISDGIQVCRRTGKMQCIKCFQEYAGLVYEAADDLPMALHFARLGQAHVEPGPHDRRWVGAKEECRLLLLQGQLEGALAAAEKAWELRLGYHTPPSAEAGTRILFRLVLALLGRSEDEPRHARKRPTDPHFEPIEAGEYERRQVDEAIAEAVVACCRGDHAGAAALLEPWDRLLRRQNFLAKWFEVRRQMVAVALLAGERDRAAALAKPLRAAAETARDYLTLRLLDRLFDPATPPSPFPTLGDLTSGPFAPTRVAHASGEESPAVGPSDAGTEESAPKEVATTPLDAVCRKLAERVAAACRVFDAAETGEEVDAEANFAGENPDSASPAGPVPTPTEVLADILAIDPAGIADPRDAYLLLELTISCCLRPSDEGLLRRAWEWAKAVGERHPRSPQVARQLAIFGFALPGCRTPDAESPLGPTAEEVEARFRTWLDLAPNDAPAWAQAGFFFLDQGKDGEAERCLARSFRLDRTGAPAVLKLAETYVRSDRQRDALAALDLYLREGGTEPEVAWQATLTAFRLKQFESALTYVDRLLELDPEYLWAGYYKAASLLELDRPLEALAACAREAAINPAAGYPVRVQRTAALGSPALTEALAENAGADDRLDEFRASVKAILAEPLSGVDCLSPSGLAGVHRRLWLTVSLLPYGDKTRREYERFLLAAGLAPDEMFDEIRTGGDGDPQPGLSFRRVILEQPLPADWSTLPECRPGESRWKAYRIPWGVLAATEEEAIALALKRQAQAADLPARVHDVETGDGTYVDRPGIVWQGFREEALD